MSGSATLKTKPTVFAKVNHEAREVRDSLFGEAEFMLTNEGLGGLGAGERVPKQAPERETYHAFRRHEMHHYYSSITCRSKLRARVEDHPAVSAQSDAQTLGTVFPTAGIT